MAYMRLDILYEIFFMQVCSCCVAVHKMVPDLFRSLHNLLHQRLQKRNQRSFVVVPLVLPVFLIFVAELGVLAKVLLSDLELHGSKIWVMFLF